MRTDHADEFMTSDAETPTGAGDASQTASGTTGSQRGAGPLGFTGTAGKGAAAPAAGLTTLADARFGGRSRAPMMPETWTDDDASGPPRGRESEPHK